MEDESSFFGEVFDCLTDELLQNPCVQMYISFRLLEAGSRALKNAIQNLEKELELDGKQ